MKTPYFVVVWTAALLFMLAGCGGGGRVSSSDATQTVGTDDVQTEGFATQSDVLQRLGELDLDLLDIANLDPAFSGASANVSPSPPASLGMKGATLPQFSEDEGGSSPLEIMRVIQAKRYNMFRTMGVFAKLYYSLLASSVGLFTFGSQAISGEFDGTLTLDMSAIDEEMDSVELPLYLKASEYTPDYWQLASSACAPIQFDDEDDEAITIPTVRMIFQATDSISPSRLYGTTISGIGGDIGGYKFLAFLGMEWPPNRNDVQFLAYEIASQNVNLFHWRQVPDANNVYYSVMDWYGSWMMDDDPVDMLGLAQAHPATASGAGYTQFAFQIEGQIYEGCVSNGIVEDSIVEIACPASIAGEIPSSRNSLVSAMDSIAGDGYFGFVAPYDLTTIDSIMDPPEDGGDNMDDIFMMWNALFAKAHESAWFCQTYQDNLGSYTSTMPNVIQYWIGKMVDSYNALFYPADYPEEWIGGMGDSDSPESCNSNYLGSGVGCSTLTQEQCQSGNYYSTEEHSGLDIAEYGSYQPRNCAWVHNEGTDEYSCGHSSCTPCLMD